MKPIALVVVLCALSGCSVGGAVVSATTTVAGVAVDTTQAAVDIVTFLPADTTVSGASAAETD